MGGISAAPQWGVEPVHSPSQIVSSGSAIALSPTPLWVAMLRIQIDDTGPAAAIGTRALFGDPTLTSTSFGLYYYTGDSFDWPFPGPIPVHKIFFLQLGGTGKVNWMGVKRT